MAHISILRCGPNHLRTAHFFGWNPVPTTAASLLTNSLRVTPRTLRTPRLQFYSRFANICPIPKFDHQALRCLANRPVAATCL